MGTFGSQETQRQSPQNCAEAQGFITQAWMSLRSARGGRAAGPRVGSCCVLVGGQLSRAQRRRERAGGERVWAAVPPHGEPQQSGLRGSEGSCDTPDPSFPGGRVSHQGTETKPQPVCGLRAQSHVLPHVADGSGLPVLCRCLALPVVPGLPSSSRTVDSACWCRSAPGPHSGGAQRAVTREKDPGARCPAQCLPSPPSPHR